MSGDQIDSWWTVATCVGTALGYALGVWHGASSNRNQPEPGPTQHCGGCDECDQLVLKPLTDAEIERGIHALRYHLDRRRGLS